MSTAFTRTYQAQIEPPTTTAGDDQIVDTAGRRSPHAASQAVGRSVSCCCARNSNIEGEETRQHAQRRRLTS